jgi:DNA-binding XRE family transcriptional regulator
MSGAKIMPGRIPKAETRQARREKAGGPTLLVPRDSDFVTATRKQLGVTQEILARLIGVSQRAVSGWEGGRPINDVSLRRVKELNRLAVELAKVMKADFIPHWLVTPNEGLGGLSPVEAMERGENDRLWRTVFLLGSGIPT